jgi:hypothetical protein
VEIEGTRALRATYDGHTIRSTRAVAEEEEEKKVAVVEKGLKKLETKAVRAVGLYTLNTVDP